MEKKSILGTHVQKDRVQICILIKFSKHLGLQEHRKLSKRIPGRTTNIDLPESIPGENKKNRVIKQKLNHSIGYVKWWGKIVKVE